MLRYILFFKQVDRHYKLLNNTVFNKYEIISYDDGYNFLDDLQLEISLPSDRYYKLAKLHIEKDYPELITKIENLVSQINAHNPQVKELDILIDNYITDSFKRSSPINLGTKYDINPRAIKDISLKIWKDVYNNIKPPIDIQNFRTQLEKGIERYAKNMKMGKQEELWIMSKQIGKGKDKGETDNIERIFKNDFLKNEDIINKLVDLVNKRRELVILNQEIRDILYNNFSQLIEDGIYDTKVKCCPSIWGPLKRIIFLFSK